MAFSIRLYTPYTRLQNDFALHVYTRSNKTCFSYTTLSCITKYLMLFMSHDQKLPTNNIQIMLLLLQHSQVCCHKLFYSICYKNTMINWHGLSRQTSHILTLYNTAYKCLRLTKVKVRSRNLHLGFNQSIYQAKLFVLMVCNRKKKNPR